MKLITKNRHLLTFALKGMGLYYCALCTLLQLSKSL
jgi:hypothetical protein